MRVTVIATGFDHIKTSDGGELKIAKDVPQPVHAPTQLASQAQAQAKSSTEEITAILDEVSAEKEEAVAVATVEKSAPEVKVEKIPSKATSKDTYKDYDDLFSAIRNRTKR